MSEPQQRDMFLSGEGDAWFERNLRSVSEFSITDDPLAPALLDLPLKPGPTTTVAEVGCGQGLRLEALHRQKGWKASGIDPSSQAVSAARQLGIDAQIGTAEDLPYADNSVDLLIFGFCLYLCDRNDLFRIAAEAHRVLKAESWLAILDFWSPHHRSNPYHHRPGVQSFKTNHPAMFLWHPDYVITDHHLREHTTRCHTDSFDNWRASTIIRKSENKSF